MSQDAYTRAGVSQSGAEIAVRALVEGLRAGGSVPERAVPLPGHYASVVRLDERVGIAMTTDGVGTKLLVAERAGRWDTVGIDCVAMNVNDLICVGAALAGIEIPGGELAQLVEKVAGVDLSGAAVGVVELDAIVDGGAVEPGDPIIGLPSSGLHSNGYTLARRALAEVPLDDERLGRPLGEILLEPTEIYVRAVLELLRSPADVRGLAHITGDGLANLTRLRAEVGYEIDDPLPVPPVFELIAELGGVSDEEMHEVFNMGCGFCCAVAASDEAGALELLRRHYSEAKVIGRATDRPGEVELAR